MKLRSRFVYYLALSVAVIIWGSSFAALKIALSEFSPVQVLAGVLLGIVNAFVMHAVLF